MNLAELVRRHLLLLLEYFNKITRVLISDLTADLLHAQLWMIQEQRFRFADPYLGHIFKRAQSNRLSKQ